MQILAILIPLFLIVAIGAGAGIIASHLVLKKSSPYHLLFKTLHNMVKG